MTGDACAWRISTFAVNILKELALPEFGPASLTYEVQLTRTLRDLALHNGHIRPGHYSLIDEASLTSYEVN